MERGHERDFLEDIHGSCWFVEWDGGLLNMVVWVGTCTRRTFSRKVM
jgi:hypothetical protein